MYPSVLKVEYELAVEATEETSQPHGEEVGAMLGKRVASVRWSWRSAKAVIMYLRAVE